MHFYRTGSFPFRGLDEHAINGSLGSLIVLVAAGKPRPIAAFSSATVEKFRIA